MKLKFQVQLFGWFIHECFSTLSQGCGRRKWKHQSEEIPTVTENSGYQTSNAQIILVLRDITVVVFLIRALRKQDGIPHINMKWKCYLSCCQYENEIYIYTYILVCIYTSVYWACPHAVTINMIELLKDMHFLCSLASSCLYQKFVTVYIMFIKKINPLLAKMVC